MRTHAWSGFHPVKLSLFLLLAVPAPGRDLGGGAPRAPGSPLDWGDSGSFHQDPGDPVPVRPVPKLESAQKQLQYAAAFKLTLRGAEGEIRKESRATAVRAYRAVRAHFPDEILVGAEAIFRAAELLRAGGDTQGALAEFAWVRDRGGESPFRVRALLEIGHLERRAKRTQPALAAYEAVLTDVAASQRQKDDASLWAGAVYLDANRPEDARRAWQRVAESGEDPLDRVRAYDHLALESIARGDLEGAAGILERCREALSEVSVEETRLGERVRAALTGMRAHEELQRAVAARAKEKSRATGGDGSVRES